MCGLRNADGLVDWDVFNADSLNRFFPLEWRDMKMVVFVNLQQGGMSFIVEGQEDGGVRVSSTRGNEC